MLGLLLAAAFLGVFLLFVLISQIGILLNRVEKIREEVDGLAYDVGTLPAQLDQIAHQLMEMSMPDAVDDDD